MHMKAPAFWNQKPGLLTTLLAPASLLWRMGTQLRRRVTLPYAAAVPVICVGNVTAGGAGKTPVTQELLRMLRGMGQQPHIVSRGYGGSARGPLRVDPIQHTSANVGDEPLLLAVSAPVWVAKHRVEGVKAAVAAGATQIILDDGLQNPSLRHDAALLVIDGESGLGNGRVIPAGPLRETLEDALPRLHGAIIIGDDQQNLEARIGRTVPVFKAVLREKLPPNFDDSKFYVAFAGIGRPEKFFASCRRAGLHLIQTFSFADHHPYNERDLAALQDAATRQGAKLITTAKDAARLSPAWRARVDVLEIELNFDDRPNLESFLGQRVLRKS